MTKGFIDMLYGTKPSNATSSLSSQYELDGVTVSEPQLTLPGEDGALKTRFYKEAEISVFKDNREVKIGPGLEVKKGNNSIILEFSKQSVDDKIGVGLECEYRYNIPNTNLYAELNAEGAYYLDKNWGQEFDADIEVNLGYAQSLTNDMSCFGEVGLFGSSDSEKKGGVHPKVTFGVQLDTSFGNVFANTEFLLEQKTKTFVTVGTQFDF